MRTIFLAIVTVVLTGQHIAAQSYTNCRYTYFKDKKVSTSTCYDKDNRWGKATAYNRSGKLIKEWSLRRFAGGEYVEFSFYPNGAVNVARWHSAPDGGIQWYNTTTTFAENGDIISEVHNNYDDGPSTYFKRQQETPLKTEVVKCAEIYSTEYMYINRCSFDVSVTSISLNRSEQKTVTVKAGDTVAAGNYIMAEQFGDITQLYRFSVKPVNDRKNTVTTRWLPVTQPGKSVRRYTMLIESL